jgi:hypothetical protein
MNTCTVKIGTATPPVQSPRSASLPHAIALLTLSGGSGGPLAAQPLPVLDPGVPVRIEAPEVERRRLTGTLRSMDRDHLELVLAADTTRSVWVPVAAVTRIDVGTPRTRGQVGVRTSTT